ncbi:MAG TPA: lysophospholipid acyltransferase family protein [Microlunatus sp.]
MRPGEVVLRSRLTLDRHGADTLGEPDGPTLIVANLSSPADPALVRLALPRRWRGQTAAVLPAPAHERWWRSFRRTEALGPDGGKVVAELLRDGWNVLVFPEGERSRDGFLAPFRADLVAAAAGEAERVLPVGIRGSYAAVPEGARWPVRGRPRVSVRLGTPRPPTADETAEQLALRLQEDVQRLIEEDASSWWATQRNLGGRALAPPGSAWRRIWEQTKAPAAGGKPRRAKIWRA